MGGAFAKSMAVATACTLIAALAPAAGAVAPDDVPGLVAWYRVDSLHRNKRGGDTVNRWTDSSGGGHHLRAGWDAEPPVFEVLQLNGKPAVAIRQGNHFDVADPFELADHTIVLVYRTGNSRRALLRSDADDRRGVLLHHDGRSHAFQNGSEGLFGYCRPRPLGSDWSITLLGRRSGVLRSFIDGVDVSSMIELSTPIRVGRLFDLRHTRYVTSDGTGMQIAEMIFYDRFLSDEERTGVTLALSDKYGIAVESDPVARRVSGAETPVDDDAVAVRLGSETHVNLNDELVAIGWDTVDRLEEPFALGPEGANTELRCSRDATRVRLTVTLPLTTESDGTRLRALILANARDYHPEEGASEPVATEGSTRESILRFQTTMTLHAGDYLEIVTSRDGAPGTVRLGPAGASLIVERAD